MIYYLLSFLLAEIYLLKHFELFWLVLAIFFAGYFLFKKFQDSEASTKANLFKIFSPLLLLILLLLLPKIFPWTMITAQIFLVPSYIIFYLFLFVYRRFSSSPDFFRIFSPLLFGFVAYLFFRSNLFENFLIKQLAVFFALFLSFESYRYLFRFSNSNRSLISFIPAFVLLEFLWVLNFLPINFLSLAGVWLVLFVLANEIILLTIQNCLNLRHFLPEVAFSFVLIVLILVSSSWQML